VLLEVIGKIEPGSISAPSLSAGQCLEVVTGSFVESFMGEPHAVAGFRDVERRENRVAIKRPFQPDENIEVRGKEKRSGTPLVTQGTLIGPREISLLAGQGILEIEVARKPIVAVFSSGNEVLSPQEPLRPGYVWDANTYALSALCEEGGGTPRFYGVMKDNLESFARTLQKALQEADMVTISGGTVAGGKNFISDLIQSAASPGIIVDGVPMRSGRPLIMGVAGTKPIVCVAGYPPEAIRGFELFGKPSLAWLLGRD
jgi:molybdenum cofactor synthesis domain-containing protein